MEVGVLELLKLMEFGLCFFKVKNYFIIGVFMNIFNCLKVKIFF